MFVKKIIIIIWIPAKNDQSEMANLANPNQEPMGSCPKPNKERETDEKKNRSFRYLVPMNSLRNFRTNIRQRCHLKKAFTDHHNLLFFSYSWLRSDELGTNSSPGHSPLLKWRGGRRNPNLVSRVFSVFKMAVRKRRRPWGRGCRNPWPPDKAFKIIQKYRSILSRDEMSLFRLKNGFRLQENKHA